MLVVTMTLNFSVFFSGVDFVAGHFRPPHSMQFKLFRKGVGS